MLKEIQLKNAKKAVNFGLLLAFLLVVACPPVSHAVNIMSDVKKMEKSVTKGVGKAGSGIKKSAKSTGKMMKKGTKKLKIHKPKL